MNPSDMEMINEMKRQVSWKIHPGKQSCRPWCPPDLWDIGSLRKAIFNELACVGNTIESMEKSTNCIEHILRCWEANLRENEYTGPSFLIHCLDSRYKDDLNGLKRLKHSDAWKVIVLSEACHRGGVFQLYVARLHRTAISTRQDVEVRPGQTVEAMQVQNTTCWLEKVMHVSDQRVTFVPKISEEDLLNDYHFEDDVPDTSAGDQDCITENWIRPVVIIVPNRGVADFCRYTNPHLNETDESDAKHEVAEQEEAQEANEDGSTW